MIFKSVLLPLELEKPSCHTLILNMLKLTQEWMKNYLYCVATYTSHTECTASDAAAKQSTLNWCSFLYG